MNKILLLTYLLLGWGGYRTAAQSTIAGTVRDAETAEPLFGASVRIKSTTQGATTDIQGNFEFGTDLTFPVSIQVSYIGYEAQDVFISSAAPVIIHLHTSAASLNEVTVTARRRNEEIQEIPIPIAVLNAKDIDNSTSFNVNRVKELVPSVQLYSSNPRNTTLNIRGIGSTFGLTNDGIDPGVGFYVDGVYYARPAATTLDFIDVQQIEVLRGPQGTLFGKNTTAGTFNITSKKPTFITSGVFEQSFGNYGFIQTKGSFSGPLVKDKLAVRLSFSGTNRDGTIYNVRTQKYTNTLNNQGFRTQLLYLPTDRFSVTVSGDYSRQRPDGYAQVFAGSAPTKRADFRQFESIIADLNYDLPSRDPFDRIIDHDTPWKSDQDMGGASVNIDYEFPRGTLTSTSAWRSWHWDPSNDRDFTGLSAVARSQAPSIHHQWSQELRYSGEISSGLNGTIGVFTFYQKLDPDGAHILEAGSDQWRFVQNNQDPLWETPGLLDGLTQESRPAFRNFSGAFYTQLDWKLSSKLILNPGVRINYDQKSVNYSQTVTGGLQTDDPDLIALQNRVFSPLAFQADVDDWNISGQLGARWVVSKTLMTYANYSYGFKPVGLNLGGIPTENGEPVLDLAVIKPERVSHIELGAKAQPLAGATLNVTVFNTDIYDYQTTVRSAEIGVIRGYLANADQVKTRGVELEANYAVSKKWRINSAVSYTDGKYVKFTNAPVALEETGSGGNELTDISGALLPGISKWALTIGVEYAQKGSVLAQSGDFFFGADLFYRSDFSSNPTPSKYLNIDGYALINARLGFRSATGITFYVWSRNLNNTNYFEQLLAAGGNTGQIGAVLGDPRTYGITVRYNFN